MVGSFHQEIYSLKSENMKVLFVCLAIASVALAIESPFFSNGVQKGEDLEYVNSRVMERLRQEAGSERGLYHVFLPDGRLQRVQYTAAPVRPAAQAPSSVFQDSQRNTYYVQVPAERLQALPASSRLDSLQQYYQQVASNDAQRNAYYVEVPTERLQDLKASSSVDNQQQNYHQIRQGTQVSSSNTQDYSRNAYYVQVPAERLQALKDSYNRLSEYQPFEVDAQFVPLDVVTADQLP